MRSSGAAFAGSSEIGAWDVKSIRKKIEIPERKGIFDLGIGAYLMNPLKSDYTYDDVAKEYLGEQLLSQEEVFSGMKKPEPKKADNEQAAAYGAYQAYVALHGKDALKKPYRKPVCGTCLKRSRCLWYLPWTIWKKRESL